MKLNKPQINGKPSCVHELQKGCDKLKTQTANPTTIHEKRIKQMKSNKPMVRMKMDSLKNSMNLK